MTSSAAPGAGDFESFYARARDGCLRAVMVTTVDAHLAEDLTAEAFSRAWARWPAVRRHPAPEAWVVRTALNLRVSWWRRLRREVSVGDTDPRRAPVTAGPRTAGGDADPGRRAVTSPGPEDLSQLDLLEAVKHLPERQRQVLALRVFLDLDTRQSAAALGIAEGTVTAHLHRATAALRQRLLADGRVRARTPVAGGRGVRAGVAPRGTPFKPAPPLASRPGEPGAPTAAPPTARRAP